MKPNRAAGITLIEIMIAVAILAIISAIAIPLYRGYIDEGRIGSTATSIRQAQLFFDDLAMDMNLAAADAGDNTVRGVYMQSGRPVLGDVGSPPAGADAWTDLGARPCATSGVHNATLGAACRTTARIRKAMTYSALERMVTLATATTSCAL